MPSTYLCCRCAQVAFTLPIIDAIDTSGTKQKGQDNAGDILWTTISISLLMVVSQDRELRMRRAECEKDACAGNCLSLFQLLLNLTVELPLMSWKMMPQLPLNGVDVQYRSRLMNYFFGCVSLGSA
jgi:hypothetical protein